MIDTRITLTPLSHFVDLPEQEQEALGLKFTPREIAQQPETWKKTVAIFLESQDRISGFLDWAGVRDALEQRPMVILVGAGTSDYIGGALELLLRKKWGCEVSAIPSTSLLPSLEDYVVAGRKYLWISFSRSGDSPEGVAVLERAIEKYPQIAHLIVTCNAGARMADICRAVERACVVVLDDAVNDRSLAMTSSYTNMIVMGHCLAHAWSIEGYRELLPRLVAAGEAMLQRGAAEAERLATQGFTKVCLVGAGGLASAAKESALKILEMTAGRVQTRSETVLGLRHGPMAALDRETLFVCFASGDPGKVKYAADLLGEIVEKGITGGVVAVGRRSVESALGRCCEVYLAVDEEIVDEYRPVVDVIFGQLLGLYCSLAHGLKPDSPSPSGVISRVVEKRFRV
jgi:tagatose-6-phosphate ketose/aldose isomerase